MALYLPYPEIVGPIAPILASYGQMVTIPSADTPAAFAVGTWVVQSTNGYIPVVSAGDTVAGVIGKIFDKWGREIEAADYVAASPSVDYKAMIIPVGYLTFRGTEDGLVTPIPDSSQYYYCDIVVSTINTSGSGLITPYIAQPVILIDSDSANSSSSSRCIQLQGLSPVVDQPAYSATAAAAPRTFNFKVITPQLSLI